MNATKVAGLSDVGRCREVNQDTFVVDEAMELYAKHLKPEGVLVVHISNVNLDLSGLVFRLAAEIGGQGGIGRAECRDGSSIRKWRKNHDN